jgi:hypothetical protein
VNKIRTPVNKQVGEKHMPDTPVVGETGAPVEPKNNVTPTETPQEKPVDPAVEAERKRAEQAEMRANQLANQLKAKEDAEAAAKAKELEDQNKFKDLYEQEKAKREKAESDKEEADRQAAIKAKTDELFKDYPEAVRELADDTGLSLSDTDEDTVEVFKAKLDKINSKVSNDQKVTPNNPGTPSPKTVTSPQEMHEMMKDPAKFEEYIKKNSKGMASMTRKTE